VTKDFMVQSSGLPSGNERFLGAKSGTGQGWPNIPWGKIRDWPVVTKDFVGQNLTLTRSDQRFCRQNPGQTRGDQRFLGAKSGANK
jgi:hypothetical protein